MEAERAEAIRAELLASMVAYLSGGVTEDVAREQAAVMLSAPSACSIPTIAELARQQGGWSQRGDTQKPVICVQPFTATVARACEELLLPPKDRAGQGFKLARMNCLGDLYRKARWGWISL